MTTTSACPECGGQTRTDWRRGYDGQLHPHLTCVECQTRICPLPERKQPTATTRYVGWLRQGGRCGVWRAMVEGQDERQVFNALLDLAQPGDKQVLPEGRHPDDVRARR